MKTSVIIPVFNRIESTKACIESVRDTDGDVEIIVVNDGSDELTSDYLRSLADVILIEHERNLGIAISLRDGMVRASGDIIVKLDSDMKITNSGWAMRIRDSLADHEIGIVAAPVAPGFDVSTSPGVHPIKAGNVNGCCMAWTRRTMDQLGYPWVPPREYGYFDAEYCLRANVQNLKLCYLVVEGKDVVPNPINQSADYEAWKVESRKGNSLSWVDRQEQLHSGLEWYIENDGSRRISFSECRKKWKEAGGDPGMSSTETMWEFLNREIRPGMKTLELGSGLTTMLFDRMQCDHLSIEHSEEWLDRVRSFVPLVNSSVLHRPIQDGWYSWKNTGGPFDLVLVDGPPGDIGRSGVLGTIDSIANEQTTIVLDDCNRAAELSLAVKISSMTGRSFRVIEGDGRAFAVFHGVGKDT